MRVFQAPRALAGRSGQPRRFADWFGGPGTEVPLSSVLIDLRLGGGWTATTLASGPDRRDIRWEGEYLDIIEPERLAFTICGLANAPDVVTVILTDLGHGRPEMLFRQHGQRSAEQYEHARNAWSVEFDHLSERLRSV